jgi:leader peptidase (prepilin peptidase)/N-methyltransferase
MEYQTVVLLILGVYFFVIGAIFGSFMNMLVYRVNLGEKLFGRSYCDFSKKPLKAIDLIPILSFIIFKGRCRDCHKKIPLLYPLVEFCLGLISVLVFFKVTAFVNIIDINLAQIISLWFLMFVICFIFVFFAYYDYLHWEVDSKSVYVALGILIFFNLINLVFPLPFLGSSVENLLAGGLLAGFIFIIYRLTGGGGMGEGDIYLFALTGLSLGLIGGMLALTITSITGSIVGIVVSVIKKKRIKGLKIQLAPFIAWGTLVVFLFKDFFLKLMGLI